MSATPTPEVRYWQRIDRPHVIDYTRSDWDATVEDYESSDRWREVTVSPVVPQGAATLADAVAERVRVATLMGRALGELIVADHPDDPHDPIARAKGFIVAALNTPPVAATGEEGGR